MVRAGKKSLKEVFEGETAEQFTGLDPTVLRKSTQTRCTAPPDDGQNDPVPTERPGEFLIELLD